MAGRVAAAIRGLPNSDNLWSRLAMTLTTETASRPATKRYLAKKDRIVAAATQVLNDTGIDGFTLARVAEIVGGHPATLGYYWRKDTLIDACIMDAAARIQAMALAAPREASPATRIGGFLEAYFDERRRIWAGEAPDLADFAEIRQTGPAAFEAYKAMFKAIAWLFKGAPSFKGPRAGAPWARLTIEQFGWSRVWVRPTSARAFAKAAAGLGDFLTEGLAAAGQVWPTMSPLELAPVRVEPGAGPKEAFLAAATETVNAHGYRGASVDRISAQLNRTKGAFYHHNADKDEVIEACFARTFQMMRQAQRNATGATGWERLAHAAAALDTSHNSASGRMLRTYALAGLPAAMRSRMVRGFMEAAEGFAPLIAEGVADGTLRSVDPAAAAQMVMVTINSSAYLGPWAPDISREIVVGAYVRPTLMGLLRTA